MPDGRTFLGSAPVEQVMRVEVVRARVRDRGRGRGRGRVGVRVRREPEPWPGAAGGGRAWRLQVGLCARHRLALG